MAARDRAGDGRHARAGAIRHRRRGCAVGAGRVRRRLAAPASGAPVPTADRRGVRGDGRRGRLGGADHHGQLQRARPSGGSRRRILAGGPRRRRRAASADPPVGRTAARLSVHDARAPPSDRQRLQRLRHPPRGRAGIAVVAALRLRTVSGRGPHAPLARHPLRVRAPGRLRRGVHRRGMPDRTIHALETRGQIAKGSWIAEGDRLRAHAVGSASRRGRAGDVKLAQWS